MVSFSWRLYPLLKSTSVNVAYSPASIQLALAMASVGARGATREQMRDVLGEAQPSFSSATQVANRLWLGATEPIEPAFLAQLDKLFHSSVANIDFAEAPEASRRTINHWVSQRTRGRISTLLPHGSVTPRTSLLVTNALCFRAQWLTAFSADATQDAPFWVRQHTSMPVRTMHHTVSSSARPSPKAGC